MGGGTKFISETLSEQMLIPEIEIKNMGFVNIRAVASEEVTRRAATRALTRALTRRWGARI